ncbi:MAG: hypothetical protein AAF614_32505 [Chloroflexota bacterium]
MNKLTKLEANPNGRFNRPNPTPKPAPSAVEQVAVPTPKPQFNLSTALSLSNSPLPLFPRNKRGKVTSNNAQLVTILL